MKPFLYLRQRSWFRAMQRKLDFPVRMRCGGMHCRVMAIRDCTLFFPHRGKEPVSHRLFGEVLRQEKIGMVIDVGANVGRYTWQALQVSPALRVIACEPDPVNQSLLRQTIRENDLGERVELFAGAVGDREGEGVFLRDEISGASGSLVDRSGDQTSLHARYRLNHRMPVPMTTLDALMDRIPEGERIFLKIDVEGAEEQVLRGAGTLLSTYCPPILMECPELGWADPLRALGYTIHPLGEHGNIFARPPWMHTLPSDVR